MKLEINLKQDAELRLFVKDLIRGQVHSIVREEIKEILKEVLTKKIQDKDIPNIDHLTRNEIQKAITKELNLQPRTYRPDDISFIKSEARKIINETVKDALSKGNLV